MKKLFGLFALCLFVMAGLNAMAQYISLPAERLLFLDDYDDLSKWTHTGVDAPFFQSQLLNGTEHTHVAGWNITEARTGYSGVFSRIIPPLSTINYAVNLRNISGAMIESPYYADGIGTLYFDAVNSEASTSFTVYIATNMVSGSGLVSMQPAEVPGLLSYNWIAVGTEVMNYGGTDFGRYYYQFNTEGAAKFKIVRPAETPGFSFADDQFLVVDNIQVSYPFEYVIMTELDSVLISNPDFSSGSLNVSCQLDQYNTERALVGSTVFIVYRTAPAGGGVFGAWVVQQLYYVAGSGAGETGLEYQGSVIVASEGEIEYYYSCEFDGYYFPLDYTGTGINYPYPSEAVSPAELYEDGMGGSDPFNYSWEFGTFPPETDLPDNRILLFDDYDDWVHTGEAAPPKGGRILLDGTYHSRADGWEISQTRIGYSGYYGNVVPPNALANRAGNLRNVAGAMIESPFYGDGVGTIYLEAVNGSAPVDLHIYMATNMWDTNLWENVDIMLPEEVDGKIYNWVEIDVLNLDYATQGEFFRYYRTLNYRGAAKVRFVRQSEVDGRMADDQFLVIDNIRISPPPTDVVIDKTEALTNPGYPTADGDFTVRCSVSNADTNVPTELRAVFLTHRWRYLDQQVDQWKTQLMELIDPGDGNGNGELYELDIPAANQVGDIEYYFSSSFVGYVYQSPDYTELGYEYPSENLSPRELRGDAADDGEFSIRLREYDSDYGAIYLVSDQHSEPIKMELVGDHKWRGMVPLGGIAPTSVSWNLRAEKKYSDGSESYATNLIYWSSTSAASSFDPVLPSGGVFGETNASKKLTIKVDDGGYMKVDFDTRTLEFLATRAEYQNFNDWSARDDYFSDSSGQSDKKRYENTFDELSLSDYRTFFEDFTTLENATGEFERGPFETPGRWLAGTAANIEERTIDVNYGPPGIEDYRNRSLRLKGGDPLLGLGYVYNNSINLPDGLQYVNFKARGGQVFNNTEICYYRNYFSESGYAVTVGRAFAAAKSPEYPYLSVITYYQDYNNFYEFRVVQEQDPYDTTTFQRDRRVSLRLLKWVNGVAEELTRITPNEDLSISFELLMKVQMTPIVGGGTRIEAQYHNSLISFDDTSATALTHGTFGVRSSECAAHFGSMRAVSSGGATTDVIGPTFYDIEGQIPDWFIPLDVYYMTSSASSPGIYKTLPDQKLNVYLQATDYDSPDAPLRPGAPDWILAAQVDIPNYSYQSVSVEINSWQSQFVMLQVGDGDSDVAVDELEISSWCAASIGDEAIDASWYATGVWIKDIGGVQDQILELDHTRTDPAEKQVLRSLYLDNGIGLMEFDYRVLNGPAKLVVEYATESNPDVWVDILSIDVPAASGWVHATAYLGDSSKNGWMRVVNDRGAGHSNAVVEINNAVVWDEPYVNEKSWLTYNVKVTSADPMRLLLDESKGCFLNNSQTQDTFPIQDQDVPNLQSPLLVNGLGTLTFQARAYNQGESATVYVYASTNGWSANPASDIWKEIARFDDINSEYYKTYSYKPEDYGSEGSVYYAIRLETEIGERRACIEEVVISEPVFPGFDITDVKLGLRDDYGEFSYHPQPLSFDDVHVEAQVSNQQLSPSNIVMYVSYYVGDDVWGVDNWWHSADIVTKRMHLVDGELNLYRTRDDEGDVPGLAPSQIGGIIGQEQNAVVQYRVWASYMGGKILYQYQEEFINPEWYYPIDINQERSNEGWSPYYFVYGVHSAIGITNAVSESSENSGDGGTSYQLGGVGLLADGEMAGIEVSLTGSGVLSFDWKVSSEADYDWLSFYEVGSDRTNRISGTGGDWEHVSVTVEGEPDADHTFRWEYEKDPTSDYVGEDCGWVDAILWAPAYELVVNIGNGDGMFTNGAVVSISADAPPDYHEFNHWIGDTNTVNDVYTPDTTIVMTGTNLMVRATYKSILYPLVVNQGSGSGSYPFGSVATVTADPNPLYMEFLRWTGDAAGQLGDPSARSAKLTVPDAPASVTATYTISISRVAGCYGRTFTESGVSGGISMDAGAGSPSDTPALKLGGPGIVPDDGFAAIETEVSGSGTISFWWKVSSESAADYLKFKVDGSEAASISGTKGPWVQVSQWVEGPSVTHTLRWEYVKNGSLASSTDAGWVDDIIWTGDVPDPVIDPNIKSFAHAGGTMTLGILGERGIPYTVYSNASLNAIGWVPVDLTLVEQHETNGLFYFEGVLLPPVGLKQGFYRVVSYPAPSGMVPIFGGTNSGTDPDYGVYSLTVSTFFMDATEVTKAQWDAVYSWAVTNDYSFDHAGSGKASNHPVHSVNWYDCVKWCNARSEMDGRTPCYTVSGSVYRTGQSSPSCNFSTNGYRLPTSDEWEYAARGGLRGKRFPWGDTITHSRANYLSNSSYSYDISSTRSYHPDYNDGGYPYTSPVGDFVANGYGLYDMAGNIHEWCNDMSGSDRSVRGGSWGSYALHQRCGDEYWYYPAGSSIGYGFRAACH